MESSVEVTSWWRRKIRSAVTLLTGDRERLRMFLRGDSCKLIVFAIDTSSLVPPLDCGPGIRFQALPAATLTNLSAQVSAEFHQRQLDRLQRFSSSFAYGVFCDDKLAHVSWMLAGKATAHDQPPNLQVAADEAEITACETLPEFRGKNLYPFAIQQLIHIARQSGIRRVYMKTHESNISSQRGIEKAGLHRTGTISLVRFPLIPAASFTLRKYRHS